MNREDLAAWLERRGVPGATFAETHVSLLAFTEDRVWKVKLPVHYPFADFSTLELRAANCEREVALNRRLAPDVYLGVRAVDDEHGNVVDYAVEMRRLPDERRLSRIAARTRDGAACVERLASLLAEFHAAAATEGEIDRAGDPHTIAALWEENLDELREFVGTVLDAATYSAIARDAMDYVAGRHPLFTARQASHHIRDGHGDLLADDVFCLDDGPRALDCLEFDDRLRHGDVVADLAFLAMDLEHRNRPDLACGLFDHYRECSGDTWPRSLEDHYVAYRALVRAKIACLMSNTDPDAVEQARSLFALCAWHLALARGRMVLVGGPPATGKTTLANVLAQRTGWPVLHSDEMRKHLAGLDRTTRATAPVDTGLYTADWTERTYRALLDTARERLAHGESVIIDASWSSQARRAAAVHLAAESRSECIEVQCDVPAHVAEARAAERATRGGDASDATAHISGALRARFEAWPGAIVVGTDTAVEQLASELLDRAGVATRA